MTNDASGRRRLLSQVEYSDGNIMHALDQDTESTEFTFVADPRYAV